MADELKPMHALTCQCKNTITDPCIVCGKGKTLVTAEWLQRMAEKEGGLDCTTGKPASALTALMEENERLRAESCLTDCNRAKVAEARATAAEAKLAEARNNALEEAAKVADLHAAECRAKMNKKRTDLALTVFESAATEAESIAAAIRKLKETGG